LHRLTIKKIKYIFIVRHGDKVRGIGDVPISKKGSQEALKTAVYLSSKKINYICASPAQRTLQTALIIGNLLKKKIYTDIRLKERIEYDRVTMLNYHHYIYLCGKSSFDRSFILPNGNTSIRCGNKFKEVINNTINKDFLNSLIISHGGIIADFLRNEFTDEYLNSNDSFFAKYKIVKPCSITKILFNVNTKKIQLLELNTTDHLL